MAPRCSNSSQIPYLMKSLRLTLTLALASFALSFAHAEDAKTAPAPLPSPAACCKKAADADQACAHGCCTTAAKENKNCEKCGDKNAPAPAQAS